MRPQEAMLAMVESERHAKLKAAEALRVRQHAIGCNDSTEHHAPFECSRLETWRLM